MWSLKPRLVSLWSRADRWCASDEFHAPEAGPGFSRIPPAHLRAQHLNVLKKSRATAGAASDDR